MTPAIAVAVGMDVGGTKTTACTITADGRIIEQAREPTPHGDPDALVSMLLDIATRMGQGLPVGIGVAGTVTRDGHLVRAPNLAVDDLGIGHLLRGRLHVPIAVANDASAALWAEHRIGAAHGVDNAVMITVGTGVGGAVMAHGQLVWGHRGHAGELGHILVEADGRPCPCGARGCLEAYASGTAIGLAAASLPESDRRTLGAADPARPTTAEVQRAAELGTPAALDLFRQAGRWLGRGLTTLVHTLDPSRIVVGGGAAVRAESFLLEATREMLDRMLAGGMGGPSPEVVMAELGDDAGMIGAALLASQPST